MPTKEPCGVTLTTAPTTLSGTVDMMCSEDYKERFKAEYHQLRIRYEKLCDMLNAWDNGELTFTPTCLRSTYENQVAAMKIYLNILEDRAILEGVIL